MAEIKIQNGYRPKRSCLAKKYVHEKELEI